MNSSSTIWTALRTAVIDAGFIIRQADIFDKQHGTFKQFVSDNTAGCDLVLHCLKPANGQTTLTPLTGQSARDSVSAFLRANLDPAKHTITYLHVGREQETDVRSLYSLWVAQAIMGNAQLIDFASFRAMVEEWLLENHYVATS